MAREEVKPPRSLSNEHTLVAQRYAGYLVGHPYRNAQQTTNVTISKSPWREPAIISDDCVFCKRLTDEEAVRRVAGFQYQIDIECTRSKMVYFHEWERSGSPDVPEPGGQRPDIANRRRFCELFQDVPTERRPTGWRTRPFPLVDLPLRLKRKLCIEWNHIYVAWMAEAEVEYDFEKRMFWREVPYGNPVLDEEHATLEGLTDDESYIYYPPGWAGSPSSWD